ncbi:MAG TPA: hypothetical protein VFJ85_00260 [Acidimicrobiales bacterium]|nr:hypothetical protein [Acidimicrobiales bacterium]
MNLGSLAGRVAAGDTVTCRPVGNSMRPLIPSGAEVAIAPVVPERIEVDDIVLVRVAGHVYLHKVLAVEPQRRRARIGNNRGGVNGWAGFDRIHGICVSVDGRRRPRSEGKIRETGQERS